MKINEVIASNELEEYARSLGVELDISEYHEKHKPPHLNLSRIIVPKENRKKRLGSKVMEKVIEYADKNNLIVVLSPSDDLGATSVERLKKFYGRFGFVPNKGRNKDYRFWESMIRFPK